MKTNYVPAIVMLSAGFIDCLFAIYNHLELGQFVKELLIVLVIFLIIGYVIKMVMDKFFAEETKVEVDDAKQEIEAVEDEADAEAEEEEQQEENE